MNKYELTFFVAVSPFNIHRRDQNTFSYVKMTGESDHFQQPLSRHVRERFWRNGQIRERFQYDADGHEHGRQCKWNKLGKLIFESEMKHGEEHGKEVYYDPEHGHVQLRTSRNGLFHGPYVWIRYGKLLKWESYKGNMRHGQHLSWYASNGQLKSVEWFEEDERCGPAVSYYEDGQIQEGGNE